MAKKTCSCGKKKVASKKACKPCGNGAADEALLDLIDILDDIMMDALEMMDNAEIQCRMFVVDKNGKVKELGMVPTTDRIKIPERIVKDCKKTVKKADVKPKKAPAVKNAKLTNDERKTILTLRKDGLSVKEIARRIHKRDSLVGAFVAGRIK